MKKRSDDPPSVYDVREDPEQIERLNEIIELLVAAGYFRARIKGLSSFDKIVGGMTWAIEMCNVDIDVDLLFHESLSIGQKIALTEKIVKALQLMECPHSLEPHQMSLEGMDCIHIFPVIQWLIKKSIEFRAEQEKIVKATSIRNFNRYHADSDLVKLDAEKEARKLGAISKTKFERLFRHPIKSEIKDGATLVKTTLLEYGLSNQILASDAKDQLKGEEEMETLRRDSKTADEGKIQQSVIGTLINEQSDEMKKIAKEMEERQKEMMESSVEGRKVLMKMRIKSLDGELSKLENEDTRLDEELVSVNEEIKETKRGKEVLKRSSKNLNEDEEKRMKRHQLIDQIETIKKEKNVFKSDCRDKKKRLEEEIDRVKIDLGKKESESKDGAGEDLEKVKKTLRSEEGRLKETQLKLGIICKNISRLQRRLDDIPSRSELNQYQRRFVELYDQIAMKHIETKKYYILYNQLDDAKIQLERELNILNSIIETFPLASESARGRDEFLMQFSQISENVMKGKDKIEERRHLEEEKLKRLSSRLNELSEKQRLYHRATDKFASELRKNETLMGRVQQSADGTSSAVS